MKKIKIIILIFLLTLPATFYLYGRGYFNMHDDLQVMRIYEMEKCFSDGQIPCRWAPDMAWGYGQAMFNYYSAFPYYLGILIRKILPLSIMATVLTLFNISLVASAIGMYLLGKELWGKKGGLISSILYVYAPYHALDVYIRGALSESFALAIITFLWLSIYKLIHKSSYRNTAFFAISLSLLLMTHNISTMIYFPFTLLWTVYWLYRSSRWRSVVNLTAGAILGLGLSSFFFLPVLFERSLIQTRFLTLDYLNYEAHFVTIKQLFLDRSWGHGPSIYGPNDEINFSIGWPHWWLVIPILYLTFRNFRKNKKNILLISGLLGGFIFTAFLTHLRSISIWKAISIISIVQFPWRFLGLSIFFVSLAAGSLAWFNFKFKKPVILIIILLTIGTNVSYFVPWNRSYKVNDQEKLSGIAFDLQQKSAILDYLPVTAPIAPKEKAFDKPKVLEGDAFTSNFIYRSGSFSFDVDAFKTAKIQIPVMYFPNWIVTSGGRVIANEITGDYGLITVTLPEGKHIIQGRFEDTPIRIAGNMITLASVFVLLSWWVYEENKKTKKSKR